MSSDPFTPQRFGAYQLRARIAAGGMAEVFLADDAQGRQVALKRILPAHAKNAEFVQMLHEEARVASGLDHPNVVRVLDSGQVRGEPFIAMEFVDGESLARVIDRARERGRLLPEALACHVAIAMCRGLAHAHALTDAAGLPLGLVHRDISPQNVLVSYAGEVKLVDFGIAKAYAAPSPRRAQTRTGMVKGKYLYFSPEQARARPLDGRTDVFATGVVLYEMLCGRLPYDGDMVKVLFRIVYGEFSRPSVWRPDVSPELEAMVLLAMAADRERRFPSAASLGEALGAFAAKASQGFDAAALGQIMNGLFAGEMAERGLTAAGPARFDAVLARWPAAPEEPQARVATAPGPTVGEGARARAGSTTAVRAAAGIDEVTAARRAPRASVEPIADLQAPRLVLDGRWAGREFACIRTALTVGRSGEADIWIDDPSLLAIHARLIFEGGAWRVVALGNGRARVNGAAVRNGRLRPGDRLELGAVAARFLEPEEVGARAPAPRRWLIGLWVAAGLGALLLGAWLGVHTR